MKTGQIITLRNNKKEDAFIRIDENVTHICCDSEFNQLRSSLRELVSQCLKKF